MGNVKSNSFVDWDRMLNRPLDWQLDDGERNLRSLAIGVDDQRIDASDHFIEERMGTIRMPGAFLVLDDGIDRETDEVSLDTRAKATTGHSVIIFLQVV